MGGDKSVAAASRKNAGASTVGGLRVPGSRELAAATLIGAAYYIGVHAGASLTLAPNPVAAFWPPNALLLAGLLLTPRHTWWMTIAAVLPAHFAAQIPLGVPWTMAACWFVSNVSEALLAATIIVGYLGRSPRFDRVPDLFVVLIVGVLLAPVLTSFLDAAFVALNGWRYTGFWDVWHARLFSDVLATVTLVPSIGISYQAASELVRRASKVQAAEAAALVSGLSVASAIVFLRIHAPALEALTYVPLVIAESALLLLGASLAELRLAHKVAEQVPHLARVSTLGELSAAIAHELNQPLNVILLNAQAALLEIGRPTPRLQGLVEILEHIVSEDKRAGEVIRRLRTLLLRGKVEMRRIDVNQCILEVLRLERTDLVERRVVSDVRLASPIPDVIGDRVQLQQVLLNLVINARDAMADNGTVERKLQVTSRVAEGAICVEISDSGHGIKDTEAIFEPFFSTKDQGIGMGLSICRSIVTAHGGRLRASKNTDRGATFHLSLPAARPEAGKR